MSLVAKRLCKEQAMQHGKNFLEKPNQIGG
jgi:hypothetical protein